MSTIELELSEPVGPASHQTHKLVIRTTLTGADASAIFDCFGPEGLNDVLVAQRMGPLLTGRPAVEIDSLSGDDAAALTMVCYHLAYSAMSGQDEPVNVRAPKLGELAKAEAMGTSGRLWLAAACAGMTEEQMRAAPASVFFGAHTALQAAKKGGPKTVDLMTRLLAASEKQDS